jgi:hypothetical protein
MDYWTMKLPNKKILMPALIAIFLFGAFAAYQVITINRAHETFEGYCKWRGLVVESKSTDYGYCKNPASGQEFKMILFANGKWYLDGDLPCGFLCF